MHKAIRLITLAIIVAPVCARSQSSNVTLPQDKGPATVNVASYPSDQQKGYKVFADRCAKCHTIARPINTSMTKPEWERYVKRMMHKPNSGISDSQGKTIFEFLAYDQEQRKDKNPSVFFKSLSDEEIAKLKSQQQ
jgi:mono/diheme cytochrome c family protein